MCKYKWVQLKSKLQHTGTWPSAARPPLRLCYRPAVFFRHLRLILLSFRNPRSVSKLWLLQNCDYFKIVTTSKLWLLQNSDYFKIVTTSKLWLLQNRDYFKIVTTSKFWLLQNCDYFKIVTTSKLWLLQNCDNFKIFLCPTKFLKSKMTSLEILNNKARP